MKDKDKVKSWKVDVEILPIVLHTYVNEFLHHHVTSFDVACVCMCEGH